jgi:hypothetical protein
MADRTTKLLLALIALGLWANVFTQHPKTAVAQDLSLVEKYLSSIDSRLFNIENGNCRNSKLC